MGLVLVGLAFIVGLVVADRMSAPPEGSKLVLEKPHVVRGAAQVGFAPGCPGPGRGLGPGLGPKVGPGALVASFPHCCWGRVVSAEPGSDGAYRYVVGLSTGVTVELLGEELTQG